MSAIFAAIRDAHGSFSRPGVSSMVAVTRLRNFVATFLHCFMKAACLSVRRQVRGLLATDRLNPASSASWFPHVKTANFSTVPLYL